jgi:hypothetical protein
MGRDTASGAGIAEGAEKILDRPRAEVTSRRPERRDGSGAGASGQTPPMSADTRPLGEYDGAGRNETELERWDRNLVELLQEVRVVQTGVQVLFAFLLTAPLAARFPELSQFQRLTYFATLLAAGGAAILLIAPTAYHRILFRLGDKAHLVNVANRFTLAGLTAVALCMIGALVLVTDLMFDDAFIVVASSGMAALGCAVFWCLAPLHRRAEIRRSPKALAPEIRPTPRVGRDQAVPEPAGRSGISG